MTLFFKEFPKIDYEFFGMNTNITLTNILRNIKVTDIVKERGVFLDKVDVRDGETPEILADEIYGDSGLYWLILLANNIVDPYFGWVLNQTELNQFVTKKYGAGNEDKPHHFEITDSMGNKLIVNETEDTRVEITNRQFEENENEKKRKIRIIKPQFVDDIIREFKLKIKPLI